MTNSNYQPKTGQPCHCRPGTQRDNCPDCEGTGMRIDFKAIRETPKQGGTCRGSYRTADGKAQIEYELEEKEPGKLVFTASGEYDRTAGQCLDSIAQAYPQDQRVQEIAEVWRSYHLNDMKAGTPEQEAEIERRKVEAARLYPDCCYEPGELNMHALSSRLLGKMDAYGLSCQWLKEAGLYEVPHPDGDKLMHSDGVSRPKMYKYGSAWLFQAIPQPIIDKIKSWSVDPPRRPLHQDKASEFLKANGLKLRISLSDSKPAPWQPVGHHYRVTLSRSNKRMTFDFWDSLANAEAHKKPTSYDILSCISSDIQEPETFEDYCTEYGESMDSIKSRQTFKRLNRFAGRLRVFFTPDEIEQLGEIQ